MGPTKWIALSAVFAALIGSAVAQTAVPAPADAPYLHVPSAMNFPVAVGEFHRRGVLRYDTDGNDESVGYRMTVGEGRIDTTVYVFPSPSIVGANSPNDTIDAARKAMCAQQFVGVRNEQATVHPRAANVQEAPATIARADGIHYGFSSSFEITSPSAFGADHPPLKSETYLFCYAGGRWSVQYRFTYDANIDARAHIDAFMRDLPWTISPEVL